jgi:hypothetical protein
MFGGRVGHLLCMPAVGDGDTRRSRRAEIHENGTIVVRQQHICHFDVTVSNRRLQ